MPTAPLDEPGLFETEPEFGVVLPLDPLIVVLPVLKSGTGAGPPRIITPPLVRPCDSCLIVYDGSGCGLMEPSGPMSLYDPAILLDWRSRVVSN